MKIGLRPAGKPTKTQKIVWLVKYILRRKSAALCAGRPGPIGFWKNMCCMLFEVLVPITVCGLILISHLGGYDSPDSPFPVGLRPLKIDILNVNIQLYLQFRIFFFSGRWLTGKWGGSGGAQRSWTTNQLLFCCKLTQCSSLRDTPWPRGDHRQNKITMHEEGQKTKKQRWCPYTNI